MITDIAVTTLNSETFLFSSYEFSVNSNLTIKEGLVYFHFLGLIYGQGSTAFSLTSLLRVIHTLPSLKKAAILSLRSATLLNYQNSLLERSKASFFCFNGIGSGIDVKHGLDKWPFSRDFSFWSSFYVNNYIDDADVQPMDRACLFNMVADNKEGICIYFRGRELRIKVVSSNYSTVSVGEGNKLLDPKTWYTIGVVAVRPRFMGKSSVIVYLNGEIYFRVTYHLFIQELA